MNLDVEHLRMDRDCWGDIGANLEYQPEREGVQCLQEAMENVTETRNRVLVLGRPLKCPSAAMERPVSDRATCKLL